MDKQDAHGEASAACCPEPGTATVAASDDIETFFEPAEIAIRGAREHNLRNVSLVLPKNALIVMTGVSGSGKSSLAFDTLYAEGQRRYVESLSSYARQFLGQMAKPDVDSITGISPSISIQQKTSGNNPRSTVGTITEIYDYLRVLYARVGQGFCPRCGREITAQSVDQIVATLAALPQGLRYTILAPVIQQQKGEHRDLFADLLKQGFLRARVDGQIVSLNDNLKLERHIKHTIDVVVDRVAAGSTERARVAEAVESALRAGRGRLIVAAEGAAAAGAGFEQSPGGANRSEGGAPETLEKQFSIHYACTHCGVSYEPPSPQLFSFNSPQGSCPGCQGLGVGRSIDPNLLVSSPEKSLWDGAIGLQGPAKLWSKWGKSLLESVGRAIEKRCGLKEGAALKEPWVKLPQAARDAWLYGLGDDPLTVTWKNSDGVYKYQVVARGFIADALKRHSELKSAAHKAVIEAVMTEGICRECSGMRLNRQARAVRLTSAAPRPDTPGADWSLSLPEVCALSLKEAARFFEQLRLSPVQQQIAEEALKEIRGRIGFLLKCGLDYLTLDRTAPTLSGGESQRIRLASQIGCGLVDVVYILDEPSIGLHPRDNARLLESLIELRDRGNTVVVVEHDEETMRAADHIVDFGPGPGVRGGRIVAAGRFDDVLRAPESVTGRFLSGAESIPVPAERRKPNGKSLTIVGARHNNLQGIDVEIPLGLFVCVTGVSGSGKSSLVNDILWEALNRDVNKGNGHPGAHERIEGLEQIDKAIDIDQSPIGRTPRSNPATYVKLADLIRDVFAALPESNVRGYEKGRFSFNVAGGRCEECEGNGAKQLEMDFLADIWVPCPVCGGKRFNHETLEIRFKGKNIADVFDMDVQQALEHFENHPKVKNLLQTLHDVGLDYLKLGQPSPSLSGGEAQRIKLARELGKRSTGKTIYLLDEPTTGLHFADVRRLLDVLQGLVSRGNTVVVVEHHLDVIRAADWVIDLGPEGGAGGGRVVAAGTPEQIAECAASHTGRALRAHVAAQNGRSAAKARGERDGAARPGRNRANGYGKIVVRGAAQHNLRQIDVEIPRNRVNVFSGPSGSGKTTLAMDTIYAEGQRRYVESLSSYARQFLGQMPKPKLEHISGLAPAIAIEQKSVGHSPRSTVGTTTEIHDYLRVLFARLGVQHCPDCKIPVRSQSADEIVERLLQRPEGTRVLLLAPHDAAVDAKNPWEPLQRQGFSRVRIDGTTFRLDEAPKLNRKRAQRVEIVLDRVAIEPASRSRIAEAVEKALALGQGTMRVATVEEGRPEPDWQVERFSRFLSCSSCGQGFDPLQPHDFSFNSVLGWCPFCEGLGTQEGAAPDRVFDDELTLATGAFTRLPDPRDEPLARAVIESFCRHYRIPLTEPVEDLSRAALTRLKNGSGATWIRLDGHPGVKFQLKGPALAEAEAGRLSRHYRQRLSGLDGSYPCEACGGSRLRDDSSAVKLFGCTMAEINEMPLAELLAMLRERRLAPAERKVAGELIDEIVSRLSFLADVGLGYLTLGRTMPSLSGGECQRIRLAGQIGRALTGVTYVLDEPTIGLHPRDNGRLLRAMQRLRNLGNTLIVVEHDREILAAADRLYDFGPGSGKLGGRIVAQGRPAQLIEAAGRPGGGTREARGEPGGENGSLTAKYLARREAIPVPVTRRMPSVLDLPPLDAILKEKEEEAPAPTLRGGRTSHLQTGIQKILAAESLYPRNDSTRQVIREVLRRLNVLGEENETGAARERTVKSGGIEWLILKGASHHNLQSIDVRIPLGKLVAVTGVSGSGKSSLIQETLVPAVQSTTLPHFARRQHGPLEALLGARRLDKVITVDQQPIGTTPASNPATYTGVFDVIRELFAELPESRIRGYSPGRFSFNRPGGRCEPCEGNGQKRIEMHFLPDVWVECDVCRGQRFNAETLAVRFNGKSIADVLAMSIGEALELFKNVARIRGPLATLAAIGLDYLTLGQPANTLSGGEAQRVKLAAELARPQTGRTMYVLDEPTTGLHFDDVRKLLKVLQSLVEQGNSVIVIEHNLDVIKTADWVIDLGPEAGDAGGYVVAEGLPEDIAAHAQTWLEIYGDAAGLRPGAVRPRALQSEHRSWTGEQLARVLEDDVRGERERLDVEALLKKRHDDVSIRSLGQGSAMPWEINGEEWHLKTHIAHGGQPCRWDVQALERVVDLIGQYDLFEPTNWNRRHCVEIRSPDGPEWFFHALTGDEWVLKLRFRVPEGSFKQSVLARQLRLKSFDEIPSIPVYGRGDRVRVNRIATAWQEVEIQAFEAADVETEAFRAFLKHAVQRWQLALRRHKVAQSPK